MYDIKSTCRFLWIQQKALSEILTSLNLRILQLTLYKSYSTCPCTIEADCCPSVIIIISATARGAKEQAEDKKKTPYTYSSPNCLHMGVPFMPIE